VKLLRFDLPDLHPGQREVAESPARFRVLAAGRRWRKTSLGVMLALRTAVAGGRAWWVAPTYQHAGIGWRFLKHLSRQVPGSEVAEGERRVRFPGGGEVEVRSSSDPDSLRGSGLDAVVLDEAAYIAEEAWSESLRPALSDRRGWALFISTPNGFNWFERLYQHAGVAEGWARWRRPSWDNPHLEAGELEAARKDVPEQVYRQEYGAEFIDLGTLRPFRPEWIRLWGTAEEPAPPLDKLVIEAGFDPAISKRDGACRSACVVAGQSRHGTSRGRIYVLHAEAGHWSVYEQVSHLLKIVRDWQVREVRIEDVAYQKALGDVLDREARLAGIAVHVELVKPDLDKLRRALGWAALVEDGTVLLGPGQLELRRAMLAVPMEAGEWDLVDAAGLCIRGFPQLQPESDRIPGSELSTPTTAKSYAVRRDALTLQEAVWGRGYARRPVERAASYVPRRPAWERPPVRPR
jgi:predicted phage terminase large subunit-like protein